MSWEAYVRLVVPDAEPNESQPPLERGWLRLVGLQEHGRRPKRGSEAAP